MTEFVNISYGEKAHQDALIKWKERIHAWEGSGMTQTDWCYANHVSITSFSSWKRRIGEENREAEDNALVDISFALGNPTSIAREANIQEWMGSIAATIEVSQVKVHVYEGASASTLRNIMEAIGNA